MTMPMPAILTQFRHPYSFPAYRAMKAAHAAGDVTNAEWAAYDEEIHVDGGSWLGFMRWNRNGVAAMPEDRTDDYLSAIDDAAADFWAATDDDPPARRAMTSGTRSGWPRVSGPARSPST